MTNQLTMTIKLRNKRGKIVNGQVVIDDGIAIANFDDPNLAYDLYKTDRKMGLSSWYKQETKSYIQKFKGKTKEEIVEILKKELKGAGGDAKLSK